MPVVVSKASKMLVVPPGLAVYDAAPKLPDGKSLVPHTLANTLMLRHLGFKVPSPMPLYYDFGGTTPFEVQRKTCEGLTEHPRFYVLNHMGTGKTKTALWAWDFLNKAGLAKKLLVVAPLSTLRFVWAREAFSTLPGRTVAVLHGTKDQRLELLTQDADIFVINHDGLKTIAEALHARADIDTLVLDELAVYRNESDRSKFMRKFAQRFTWVWGLTGAPMPNSPLDVWSQCRILTPSTVPQYKRHAESILMERLSQYVLVPKKDAVEKAFQWMQPSVRYSLDDVVELPDITTRTIDVAFSDEQKKVYKEVATNMQTMVKQQKIVALNAGAAINKLLQISGGWVYHANPDFTVLDATPRLEALLDIIESAERKMIVYVPYRHMIEGIGALLKVDKVDFAMVHGDTTEREKIFHLFQNSDKYHVLLAHPGTISHGLTLTAASTIIWFLPITSLEVYEQANARIRRVGQRHKQQILHLKSSPIEGKIYSLLSNKQRLQEQFLTLVEEATDAV